MNMNLFVLNLGNITVYPAWRNRPGRLVVIDGLFFCTMQRRIVSCSFNRSKLELNNRNVERPFPVNIQTLIYNTAINFCARFLYFLSLCIFCILYIFISSYEFRCKCLAHLSFSLFPLFFSSVLYFLYLFHVFSSWRVVKSFEFLVSWLGQ